MFKKILIANRGEIAMRIIRCCREMGIRSVLACSQEDLNAMPAQFANEIVCIGPAPAGQSYLNQNALVQAARSYGCEAIHPGYGFLSENAEFARLCEEAGVKFIGPSSRLISLMGDKQSARALMQKKGVPVVPGSDGILESAAQARKIARKIGYPVLLKASAGGGGRGMRIARNEAEVEKAFSEASAEAKAAFGDGSMYLEKLIHDPRHIEVQIIGDEYGHIVQLGERDCSMQRRNQKLLEEAPAPGLTRSQRGAIQAAALKAAKAAGYYSAGTVEFVMDQNGKFYFIEMNTRMQVEHCVTEMTTGIDLMQEQIQVADGRALSFKQSDVKVNGHAIECRINAEDPERAFVPCPGNVDFIHMPGGMGVRCESAMYSGAFVSPYYDSLIAKVIVHAPTRLRALRKMRAALEETTVDGIKTNLNFLYLMMFSPGFVTGRYDTSYLAKYSEAVLKWDRDSRKKVKRGD